MKKIFKKYYESWFIPILSAILFLIIGFFVLGLFTKISYDIAQVLICLSFLLFIISIIFGIIKILNKNYRKGIAQTLVSIITLIIGFGYISFFMMFYPNDYFTEDLELPKNIKLSLPSEYLENGEKEIHSEIIFDLINGSQPGLYEYNFTTKKIDSGYIYLRAFEITKNTRLSEEELNNDSKIFVYNPTDSLKTFSTKNDFTIYEGDWNKPYGAKFEVWYQPLKGTEKKLLEKNYKIFGWQR